MVAVPPITPGTGLSGAGPSAAGSAAGLGGSLLQPGSSGLDAAAPDQLRATPAGGAEAEAFRASHAEMRAEPGRPAGGALPDMAHRIEQMSQDVGHWFQSGAVDRPPLTEGADPAAQMRDLYEFASKQFLDNSMLSMKLNVTNQEMEALNKDKDQLMRGGS